MKDGLVWEEQYQRENRVPLLISSSFRSTHRTTGGGADRGGAPQVQHHRVTAAMHPEGHPEEEPGHAGGDDGAARHPAPGRHYNARRYGPEHRSASCTHECAYVCACFSLWFMFFFVFLSPPYYITYLLFFVFSFWYILLILFLFHILFYSIF